MADIHALALKAHTLAIFRGIFNDGVISKLLFLAEAALSGDTVLALDAYSDFAGELYARGGNLSTYVLECVQNDENPYLDLAAQNRKIPAHMQQCLEEELAVLQDFSRLTGKDFRKYIDYDGFLPDWQTKKLDFPAAYARFIEHINVDGYGVFTRGPMFTLEGDEIIPALHRDKISLSSLYGYERQRGELTANTLALIEGRPAANTLLYGDSGTGKSSTVKALANEYQDRGLRLIEIRKSQLATLPTLIQSLADNPLRFILFIDDLSFTGDGDDFVTLKAVLEGSVLARSQNIAVYVTSNRRRLIGQSFAERNDDVHEGETVQQKTSLSDRFGLSVAFFAPNKDEYLEIVQKIAQEKGLRCNETLLREAEVFALHKGGRSPRAARQFIDQVLSAT